MQQWRRRRRSRHDIRLARGHDHDHERRRRRLVLRPGFASRSRGGRCRRGRRDVAFARGHRLHWLILVLCPSSPVCRVVTECDESETVP